MTPGNYFLPPKIKNNRHQALGFLNMKDCYLDQEKYQKPNMLTAFIIKRFFKTLTETIHGSRCSSVLDVGCGEGVPLLNIFPGLQSLNTIHGFDFDDNKLRMIKKNIPQGNFVKGNGYNLPYKDKTFDLVICLEVLEHLSFPEKALGEIKRVSSHDVLFSVPDEPLWSFLNVMRLRYLKDLGNTPGHCQKWSSNKFENFIKNYFKIKSVRKILPWTIIFCSHNEEN